MNIDVLGVVPIFVNAGAAILPVILGALASALALLLRPRELARACRRRPGRAAMVLACVPAIWLAVGVMPGWLKGNARQRPDPCGQAARAAKVDWAVAAMGIIRAEQAGAVASTTASLPAREAQNVGLGRDFARGAYDGAGAPLGLRLLWQHVADDTMYLSSPAVVGGRVYGASCMLDVAGKYGSVLCLEAGAGKLIWETSAIGSDSLKPFFSSPAISKDGRSLVIGQGLHDDADCALLCLDTASGKCRWQVKTPLHIEGSPAIWNDMVVAGAGAIEGADRKPAGHTGLVLAVRISDGATLWQYQLNDPESSPAIGDDGTVYIGSGFNGSAVVALRSESDEELRRRDLPRLLWRTPAPHPVTGAVTLAGELVIVGGGNGDYVWADPNPAGAVMALDRRTGQVRWKTPLDDAVLGAVAAGEGKLICPVRSGEVAALDIQDGRILWRQRVSGKAPVLAGVALAGRCVYAVSKDGYLAVMDSDNGRLIEKHYLNLEAKPGQLGLTLSSPTVVGGRVYVGSETGGLQCLAGARMAQ